MIQKVRYVGLDVHAESIVLAVAEPGDAPAVEFGRQAYDMPRLLVTLKRLGRVSSLKVCYEAGPTGFGLQRFLRKHGVECVVVAPALVPVKAGVMVKTDPRDARKLAHFLRSGDLTPIWVPDEATEALRDLERSREDARLAERRARQQLLKFLLRHDRRFTEGKTNWTQAHWRWIVRQTFAHEASNRVLADYVRAAQQATERVRMLTGDIAELVRGWALGPLVQHLQAFHGIQLVTAVGLAAEVADFQRFVQAGQFMAFTGLVPSEHSSGKSRRQGGITKTGNRHVRRLLIEAAWHYYNASAGPSAELQRRRAEVPAEIVDIAEKARRRLRRKAFRLKAARKSPNKIVTALARELAGFIWAAACTSARLSKDTPVKASSSGPVNSPARERSTGPVRGRGGRHLRDGDEVSPASATPAAPARAKASR